MLQVTVDGVTVWGFTLVDGAGAFVNNFLDVQFPVKETIITIAVFWLVLHFLVTVSRASPR
jgi:hypothetical protein